jgi:simple sugar transport system permease protein
MEASAARPDRLFVASSVRLAMPMLFSALGELVSERAGVLNLSLEGMMLMGAFAGAMGSLWTGQPLLGLLIADRRGAADRAAAGLAQRDACTRTRSSAASASTSWCSAARRSRTASCSATARACRSRPRAWKLPGLGDLPIVGPALFQQSALVWLAFGLAVGVAVLLRFTALGLAVHAAGAEPVALDKSGGSVRRVRYGAVLFAGRDVGARRRVPVAGRHPHVHRGMTNGAGYLALVGVIFGNWKTARTVFACLFFGAATALQFQLPALGIDVPTALLIMLPYVMALLAVAGLVGRQSPPAALTQAYLR